MDRNDNSEINGEQKRAGKMYELLILLKKGMPIP